MVVFNKKEYLSHLVGEDPLLNEHRIELLAKQSPFQDIPFIAITKVKSSLDSWLSHTDKKYRGQRDFYNADMLSLYYGVKEYVACLDNARSQGRVKAWRDVHGFAKPFHVSRNLFEFILKPYVSQEIIGITTNYPSSNTDNFSYVGIRISEKEIAAIPKEESDILLEAI